MNLETKPKINGIYSDDQREPVGRPDIPPVDPRDKLIERYEAMLGALSWPNVGRLRGFSLWISTLPIVGPIADNAYRKFFLGNQAEIEDYAFRRSSSLDGLDIDTSDPELPEKF